MSLSKLSVFCHVITIIVVITVEQGMIITSCNLIQTVGGLNNRLAPCRRVLAFV